MPSFACSDRHPDPEDVVTALDLVVAMLLPLTERRNQQWRALVGRLRRELVRLRAAGSQATAGSLRIGDGPLALC